MDTMILAMKKFRLVPYLLGLWIKRYILKIRAKTKIRITKWKRHPVKIMVGASGTRNGGWIATEKFFFDITSPVSVRSFLGGNKIDALFAEHVIEHLEIEEFTHFLKIFSQLMSPNGTMRIAVPDEMHPSPWYRNQMGISGLEPGADDHRAFWNYQSMSAITNLWGFKCQLLEYFDEEGFFHYFPYEEDYGGRVTRSSKNYNGRLVENTELQEELFEGMNERVAQEMKNIGITYTSLVVDLRLN
jgi:predicted SAM-dependent methyltransferase